MSGVSTELRDELRQTREALESVQDELTAVQGTSRRHTIVSILLAVALLAVTVLGGAGWWAYRQQSHDRCTAGNDVRQAVIEGDNNTTIRVLNGLVEATSGESIDEETQLAIATYLEALKDDETVEALEPREC
jgi:hypothetical protein